MEEQMKSGSSKNNGDPPEAELSPNFRFKVIMGFIFLFFTIYFIYLLVRMLTR